MDTMRPLHNSTGKTVSYYKNEINRNKKNIKNEHNRLKSLTI